MLKHKRQKAQPLSRHLSLVIASGFETPVSQAEARRNLAQDDNSRQQKSMARILFIAVVECFSHL